MTTTIRKLLILSLIILSITPVILLSGILSWQSYIVQQTQAIDIQKKLSMLAAAQISSYLREQELILSAVINNIDCINMGHAEQHLILAKLLSSSSDKEHGDIFSDISLLDGKGKELARVSRSLFLKETDLGDQSQADEFAVPAKSGEIYYSPVYFDEQTGEPFLKISLPITDLRTMEVKGMLIAEIRMKYMRDIIAHMNVGKSGIAYLLDKNGRIIAHPNPSVVLRGTYFKAPEQPGITTGLNGEQVVSAAEMTQVGEQIFYVVTELPVAEALRNTYRSLLAGAVFLMLTLSCAITLGFVLIRKIVRPIESLAGTAHAISKGDFSQKAKSFRNDETGTLANAFNLMTSKLIETINTLERQMVELKRAEEKIKASLEEKVILLREIHHRVKNNMQVISSILQLQSGYVKDAQSLSTLQESKNRVDVMALIHEKLYQSKSLARIDFQEYIHELTTSLFITYGVNSDTIKLEIHAEGIFFDINTAIPCGLIINELVSNSLKHAFPAGRKGKVLVGLASGEGGGFTLTVSDDGIGLPKDFDLSKIDTLGLQVVNALTGQLDGAIEFNMERGTTFMITFYEVKHKTTI